MKESLYLRIINAILLPGFEQRIDNEYPHVTIALSQASPVNKTEIPNSVIEIERLTETVKAGFITESNDPDFIQTFNENLEQNISKTAFLLKVISGREIKKVSMKKNKELNGICYKYFIIINSEGNEHNLEVIIESRFFNILYPPFKSSTVHENIIGEISPFFEKPDLLWPSFETVVESLPVAKLADLFNQMIQRKDITSYQTAAAIILYPHLKEKIFLSLSKNIQKDLEFTLSRYKGTNRITKMDGICAVYTVEEGLKKLFLEGKGKYIDDLGYISEIFIKINRYRIIQKRDFMERINQLEQNRFMEKIIPLCSETVLRRAFSGQDLRENILRKYITEKRVEEIFDIEEKISLEQKIEAEIEFIKVSRKIFIMSGKKGHESFSYLIASINSKNDFYILLSETGWYTLSSALKGADIKIVKKVTDNLPLVPSAIIKDIFKGKLNPDIIHDEKQILRARKKSVDKILSLYCDCLIDLEIHDFSE